MRPEILFPLAAPLTSLAGIGKKFSSMLGELCGVEGREPCIADLLWHLPVGIIDRSQKVLIGDLENYAGKRVMLEVTIGKHSPSFRRRGGGSSAPYRVEVYDDSAMMSLVFFHARADYLKKTLPLGETRFISGVVEFYREVAQMTHPEYILTDKEFNEMPIIEPVYPLRAGITLQRLGKIIRAALKNVPQLNEWDEKTKNSLNFPDWASAIQLCHNPKNESDLLKSSSARQRLALDELFANQLALALIRHWLRAKPALSFATNIKLRSKVLEMLDFELTQAQKSALAEIDADMKKNKPMLRLLQGDVGSGKTITAFLAMLNVVESNGQAAMMVPTEILTQQHGNSLRPLCEACGLKLAVLTSRLNTKQRSEMLSSIASGEIDIIIGTHSLFQKQVVFSNLNFVVIDEQHRFGVHQRLELSSKSKRTADVLVMTATPIPRTLTLTAYGDMDISLIKEKPLERKPIATRALPLGRIDEIVKALKRAVMGGGQAYWVCPLIEKGESSEGSPMTAVKRYEFLQQKVDFTIGLVHGRLKAEERDQVLAKFNSGEINLLVATSIIEVGIDVPNATIMVIEHAEKFGLTQLHQLRGRVGRSDKLSHCLLVYREPLSEIAHARLDALRQSNDGFHIAEEDLRLRGFGDLLGTKQSGMPEFKLADMRVHKKLLEIAYERASEVVKNNPQLKGDEGEALKVLLYLFRRDEVVKYPRSG